MGIDPDRRDEEADRPTDPRREHRTARPSLLYPSSEHCGRGAEKEYCNREYPTEIGQLPVFRRRLRDAEELGHRQIEDAERISLADTQMHAQRSWREEPARVTGLGYRMASIQKREHADFPSPRRSNTLALKALKAIRRHASGCTHGNWLLTYGPTVFRNASRRRSRGASHLLELHSCSPRYSTKNLKLVPFKRDAASLLTR